VKGQGEGDGGVAKTGRGGRKKIQIEEGDRFAGDYEGGKEKTDRTLAGGRRWGKM